MVTEAVAVKVLTIASMVCLVVAVLAIVALAWARRAAPPDSPLPAAFVINLPRDRLRLDAFQNAYRLSDMRDTTLLRIDAFDGGAVDWSTYVSSSALEQLLTAQRAGTTPERPDLTPGAVGQYLSHMEAWRNVARSGAAYGFVFEDTAQVPRDMMYRFELTLEDTPADWDIVLMGFEGSGHAVGAHATSLTGGITRHHAYAITAAAARKLYTKLLPIDQPLGSALSTEMAADRLKVYGTQHPVIKRDATHAAMVPI